MIKAAWKSFGSPTSYRIASVLACIYLAIAELGKTGSWWSFLLYLVTFYCIWSLGLGSAKRPKENERATRQRDALLAALRQWMPELRAHTQASHLTDGFRPRRNRYDDDLDQAVQAIQQATDTKGNP